MVARAVAVFARTGYWATPVTEVATAAKISPASVFRLFDNKLGLFLRPRNVRLPASWTPC